MNQFSRILFGHWLNLNKHFFPCSMPPDPQHHSYWAHNRGNVFPLSCRSCVAFCVTSCSQTWQLEVAQWQWFEVIALSWRSWGDVVVLRGEWVFFNCHQIKWMGSRFKWVSWYVHFQCSLQTEVVIHGRMVSGISRGGVETISHNSEILVFCVCVCCFPIVV